MAALQQRVDAAAGRHVELIGEGWNFGEVADGRRFVQASQLSLAGSGIGTFSDRARDAIRGGSAGDSGSGDARQPGLRQRPGVRAERRRCARDDAQLLQAADLVRAGLAGTLRDYRLTGADGRLAPLGEFKYGNQPAGYASQPAEVVNYVENHDNQTLWDIDAYRLPAAPAVPSARACSCSPPRSTPSARASPTTTPGIELLRSKSLDRNSFDSGDWFNRLDWSYQDNHFGSGCRPKQDNGRDWELMRPLLLDPALRATPADIAFMRDAFRDLLRIRASSTLFRLRTADECSAPALRERRSRPEPGGDRRPPRRHGLPGANFKRTPVPRERVAANAIAAAACAGRQALALHPVQRAARAADARARRRACRSRRASACRRAPPWCGCRMSGHDTLLLFGATGDLSLRYLFPSLVHLLRDRLLPPDFQVVAIGRQDYDDEAFRAWLEGKLPGELERNRDALRQLLSRTVYRAVDLADAMRWCARSRPFAAKPLRELPGDPADLFIPTCEGLEAAGLLAGPSRLVLEKPIGHDLESAREINSALRRFLDESRIFRIDHYLGKAPVQNLFALRFGNTLMEAVWHHRWIASVDILVAETAGVDGREGYYAKYGALRDMVQNHMLQLLALIAMEPPGSLDAQSLREEKRKVLKALRPMRAPDVLVDSVRGRYRRRRGRRARGARLRPRQRGRRPSSRCARTSTTGAGPACPSAWSPASAWPQRTPRCWCPSARPRTGCSTSRRPGGADARTAC
jgi:hypothetical protein